MKKKVALIAPVLFLSVVMGTYAEFGIGLQGGWNGGGGGALLLSPKDTLHFALGGYISDGGAVISVSGDLWALNIPIVGDFKFYLGPGLYGHLGGFGGDINLGAGVRLPIGFDFRFQQIELFVQGVPAIGLWVQMGNDFKFLFPAWTGLGGNIGIRFWL